LSVLSLFKNQFAVIGILRMSETSGSNEWNINRTVIENILKNGTSEE